MVMVRIWSVEEIVKLLAGSIFHGCIFTDELIIFCTMWDDGCNLR